MKKTLALLTVLSAFTASPAFAETVIFNGTVDSTCTITGVNGGTLAANTTANELNSTLGGAGSFSIAANASIFTLAVSDPTGWDTSPTGTPATTFVASATLGTDTAFDSAPIAVPVGSTPGAVNLAATTAGTFPNGSYTATVTITCS